MYVISEAKTAGPETISMTQMVYGDLAIICKYNNSSGREGLHGGYDGTVVLCMHDQRKVILHSRTNTIGDTFSEKCQLPVCLLKAGDTVNLTVTSSR